MADVLPEQDKCIPPQKRFPLTHVRRASLRGPGFGLAFAGLPSRCPRLHPPDPPTAGRFSPVGRSRHASIQRPHGTPLSGRFEFFLSPVTLPQDISAHSQSCSFSGPSDTGHCVERLTAKQKRVSQKCLPFDFCLTRCCLNFDLCLTRCCLEQSSQQAQRAQ